MYYSKKGIGSVVPAEKLAYYSTLERDYDKASQYLTLLLGINRKNIRYAMELGKMLKRDMGDSELYAYIEEAFKGKEFDEMRQKLYVELGVKKGIQAIPLKEDLGLDIQMKIKWFNREMGEATKLCLKGLSSFKKKMLPIAIAYYFDAKSPEVREEIIKLDKTAKIIVEAYEGKTEFKKMNYQGDLYLSVMRELTEMKDYESFGKLFYLKQVFQPMTVKKLGEMLFLYYFDDLALECYVEYLQTNDRDHAVWLKASEMLYTAEKYEEATVFADTAAQKGSGSFRVVEIIIESLKKLEEYTELMNVCQKAIEQYPNSSYLMETIEETL